MSDAAQAPKRARARGWARVGRVILRALAGVLIVALLVVVVYVYLTRPPAVDLAPLLAAGEGRAVTITRDVRGVPHVHGETDADAAFGLAYAHAEDDFKTIQKVLLAARGSLGAVDGPKAAKVDFLVHMMGVWQAIDAGYERELSPETRALVEAYADGLNYYGALHPDELLDYALPVRGRDVIAGFAFKTPLFYGFDEDVLELFGDQRQRAVSLEGDAPRVAPTPDPARGSQGIAVAPSRSADGATRLLVNSHQPLTGPVAWYEAHVSSDEGWDMIGGLFPGSPVILHGHNHELGWAMTVNRPDLVDIYVLETDPARPGQYLLDGEWRAFETREIKLLVRLWGPLRWTVTRELKTSAHGPVLERPHGVYALRWAGMGELRQVEQFYRMNKARTRDEWLAAVATRAQPSINFVYADARGNISYLYNASAPRRPEGHDWRQYLPGDRGALIWDELVPLDALPQVVNPPSGLVFNANNTPFHATVGPGNPDPAAFSRTLGIESHMTNRALRIEETYGRDESITRDEFRRYKYDKRYAPGSPMDQVVRAVLESDALPDDPVVAEARELLAAWDMRAELDSEAAALATMTAGETLNYGHLERGFKADPVAAFVTSARKLHARFGRVGVPWREINRLRRGDVDLPLGGGPDTLRAVYGTLDDDTLTRALSTGDSFIMFVEWDAAGRVSSRAVHAFGSATLDESSPHYADQAALFAEETERSTLFHPEELAAETARRYRPGEELAP